MGQTLSEPITDKHTDSGENVRFLFGVSEMQGWRIGMEDAHATILQLSDTDKNAFFAVYDGHGGSSAAKYAGGNVHKRLITEDKYKDADFTAALKRSFLGTDEDLRADSNFFRDPSGCTAVAALLTENKIFVANAGDSRAVLCLKGEAKPLSFDHKPQNEGESARIKAAGGFVEFGRVNGNLALSRAIGDFEFKQNHSLEPEKQIVTADPEITEHEVTEDDEFLVLACDGIWDCLTSQQVMDLVRRMIAQRKELSEICEAIMDTCLAPDSDINGGLGCDNMTVTVVALLNGKTKEEWYNWMVDRVEKKYGYETPEELPQLYAPARVAAARERWANPQANRGGGGSFSRGGFGALARVFGSNITFHPSGGIGSGDNLMFDQDDSSDGYESGEDANGGDPEAATTAFWKGLRGPGEGPGGSLQEIKDGDEEMDELDSDGSNTKHPGEDGDGDVDMGDGSTPSLTNSTIWSRRNGKTEGSSDSQPEPAIISPATPPTCVGTPLIRAPSTPPPEASKAEIQGEAPPPPQPNGIMSKSDTVEQLHSPPGGDAADAAVKLEGLSDKSEDPLKSATSAI